MVDKEWVNGVGNMVRKWCLDCSRYVNAEKKSYATSFFTGWGGVRGVEITAVASNKERCPICNGTNFTEVNPKTAKKLE